jgi:hypothetical protein
MPEYVKRMLQEKEDLEGKIKRAKKAVENPPYGMDLEDKNYLETQIGYMEQYLDVLNQRIQKAGGNNAK